ncbi:hypothetical protein ACFSO7_13615 [Bacillus sp. CGMCC 1.16607]|uniref:hypothetical protein n=1 Tax=Bacillus sp. CGMCC 1.16607 TaxID=3351842 RepID=UPI0036293B75
MDINEGPVEVSYKIISDVMDILTVVIFIDKKLLHIVAGKKEIMIAKLNKLFD